MNLCYVVSWVRPDGTKCEFTTTDAKSAVELGSIICRMYGIKVRIVVREGE